MKTKWMLWMGVVAVMWMGSAAPGLSYNPDLFMIADEGGSGGMGIQLVGNYLVWQDMIEMQWFGYDLTKRESFPIVAGMPMMPMMNESYIVWSDNMGTTLNAFELATRRRFTLAVSDADTMSARLTGRYLIYRGMMDMTLHALDLASGVGFDITSEEIDNWSIQAAGDFVIWRTMGMPGGVLAGYQLSTRQEFILSDTGMIDLASMKMNDRFAVWIEMPAEPTEAGMFCFDLAKREKFRVTDQMIDTSSVRIGGNIIAWTTSGNRAMFGFDTAGRETFEIAAGNVDTWSLVVNDQYALWRDTGSMRFCGFELATRRLITTGVESMNNPTLAKSLFFWNYQDMDLMTYELRGYDLATGIQFPVSPLFFSTAMPPIAEGDYVIWSDMDPQSMAEMLFGARIWKVTSDLCAEAATLTAGVPFLGDSSRATGTDQTECSYDDWRDTWHVFRPTRGGDYTLQVHSDAFDTTLGVFESCSGQETACNDDAGLTTDSRLVVTLVKAKPYYIRVAGVDGSGGPYELTVSSGSCATPLSADLNGDCKVNMPDLAIFASQWLK